MIDTQEMLQQLAAEIGAERNVYGEILNTFNFKTTLYLAQFKVNFFS